MIDFQSPMLARPLPENYKQDADVAVEEKYDGHRILIAVGAYTADLFGQVSVTAWSRNGLVRGLPIGVVESMRSLPNGLYDGELVSVGSGSWAVTDRSKTETLVYYAFDLLQLGRNETMSLPYRVRRNMLANAISSAHSDQVSLASAVTCGTHAEVQQVVNAIWARGGEGAIIKDRQSVYEPGKRSKAWYKMKKLLSATLTVTGFKPGRMGPHATFVLVDEDGNETTVKWKSLADLAEVDAAPNAFIGRRLTIEFQERTPSGSYRHPRFDHWE